MTGAPIGIRRWSGDETELRSVAALHGAVFAEPPYLEPAAATAASFVERVRRYSATEPDLRLDVARRREAHGADEPVGMVLGIGVDDRDWWWGTVTAQLEPAGRRWWLAQRCFAVAELAVAPAARRTGTASRLLLGVVAGLPYDVAVLTCDPRAPAALAFYRSQGWRAVQDLDLGDGVARLLLALPLDPAIDIGPH